MFRRSRLSVKPNVKAPAGSRGSPAPVAPQPSPVQSAPDLPPAQENESVPCDSQQQPIEKARGIPNSQREDKTDGVSDAPESSKPSSVVLQRRKRISTAPNIAKPRVSLPCTVQLGTSVSKVSQSPPPPLPPSSSTLFESDVPEPAKHTPSVSPKKRGINKPTVVQHISLPEKKTPVPQVPQFSPFKKLASKDLSSTPATEYGSLQKEYTSPLKERPTQEGSQQEETAASSEAASKKVQHQSDRERILKAQKLRELLRKELKKERKLWKEKHPTLESTPPPDRSRMTMRDFIYYLPDTNPMKSALEQEKKSEKSPPVQIQAKEPEEKNTLEAEEEEEEEETNDGPLLVPRVKVAEDGTIILDEESLTVEVLRAKGPIVEENDPIFERGSTTTYSSFKKSSYSKPWSNKETDMFFLAISMVGMDFSMIGQLFPHRARIEIKNKFKREERANGWRIDKAFKEKRPFDFSFFGKLLEKILAEEKKRKEKSVKSKTSPQKKKTKPRRKKGKVTGGEASNTSKAVDSVDNYGTEGDDRTEEKENEGSLNVPEGHSVSKSASTKKKIKKKKPSDSNESVPNPAADDIPVHPSKAQKSSKKRKIKVLKESGAITTDSTSQLELSEQAHSRRSEEEDSVADGGPKCPSPAGEEAEKGNDDSSRDSEQAESGKSIRAVRGRQQRPNPHLIKQSRKNDAADLKESKGNNSRAGTVEKTPVVGGVSSSESVQEKMLGNDIKDKESRSSSAQNFIIMEESKSVPINLAPLTRGRFQKPKPNLDKAVGKKEMVTTKEETIGPRKEDTDEEENSFSTASEFTNDREHSIETPLHSSPSQLSREEKYSATPDRSLENDCQPVVMDSPGHRNKAVAEHPSSIKISITTEKSKTVDIRLAPRRGRIQKPKPNLGSTAKKVPMVEEKTTEPEIQELPLEENPSASTRSIVPSPTACGQAKNYQDLNCSASLQGPLECADETSDSKSRLELVQTQTLSETSRCDENFSQEESKQQSLKLATRGRRLRPQPILPQTAARKESPLVDNVTEEEEIRANGRMQKKVMRHNDSKNSSSSIDISQKRISDKEEGNFSASKSPIYGSPVSSDLQQKLEDGVCLVSPERPLECVGQSFPVSSPVGFVQNKALTDTCRSIDFQEEGNPQPLKSTARGRLQRPKPNIGKIAGRKKMPVIENELVENNEYGKQDDPLVILDSTNSDVENVEESPSNLGQSEHYQSDLGSIDEIKKDRSAKNQRPRQKSLGCSDEKEQEDHYGCIGELSQKQHSKYDEDATSLQEHSQPASPKLAQLRRGRFQKPKSNLGRAAGRNSGSATENITLERPAGEKSEKSLEHHDGIKCKTQPTLATSESQDEQMSFSKPLINSTFEEVELPNLPQQSSSHLPVLSESKNETENRAETEITEKTAEVHESPNLDFDSQEKNKPETVNPALLRRSRLQRPKPNFVRVVGRKDIPIPQESSGAGKSKDTAKQLDDLLCSKHYIQNDTTECKPVPGPLVELDNGILEKSTQNQGSIESSYKLPGAQSTDQKEDSSSTQHQAEDSDPDVNSTTKLLSDGDGKKDVLSPTQQVRGRLLRPRPNLVRATSRKGTQPASFNDTNEEQVLLASAQQITSVKTSSVGEPDAYGKTVSARRRLSQGEAVDSIKTILPVEHDLSARVNFPEISSRPPEEEDILLPTAIHERVLDKEPSSRMCIKQDTIKLAPLLRRRSQKPKPNLARSTTSSKEHTDKDKETPVQCDMQAEQHTYSQQNPGNAGLDREVNKRKVSVEDDKEVPEVSPKRSRRSSIQTPKSPEQYRSDREQTKDSQPTSQRAAITDKPLRLRKQDKLIVPLKPALQPKLAKAQCDAARGEKGKTCLKRKQNITKNSKKVKGKSPGRERGAPKTALVTLRASVQEDEDEDDEVDAGTDYDEANEVLPPEEINRAPVFVPRGLRSPNPVPVNVEETMEEFDMSINVSDSHCFTDVDHLPSDTNDTKEENTVFTIENLGTLQNNAIPEMCTVEQQESVDVSTEAALALLAIGDPALQARLSTQGISCHGEKRDKSTTLESQHYIESKVIQCDPVCVSSITVETLSAFEKESRALPDIGSTEKRLELKEDNNSNGKNSNSDLNVAGSTKPSRSRFSKPKPNIGRALSIKRSGNPKPVPVPKEQVDQVKNAERTNSEGTMPLQNVGPQSDQNVTGKTGTSGFDDCIAPETNTDEKVLQMNRCAREGEEICEFNQIQTMQQGSITPPQYSSSQSSESGHSVQDTGQLAIISDIYKKQEEENQLEDCQCPNISITNTTETAAMNLNSSGSSVEEQTIILTLVEIPSPPIDGYHEEAAPSILQDLLPAPVLIAPAGPEMLDVNQTLRTETLKAAAVTEVNSLPGDQHRPAKLNMESNKLVPNQKSRKRDANVQEINDDELPAKKIILHTFQAGSLKSIYKAKKLEIGNLDEAMPQGPRITPNNAGSNFSRLEHKDPLSASQSVTVSNIPCNEGIVTSKQNMLVANEDKGNVSNWKNKPSKLLERTASSSKTTITRPVRKPLGFLPLLCKKPDLENDMIIKNRQSRFGQSQSHDLKRLPSIKSTIDVKAVCNTTSTKGASSVDETQGHGSTSNTSTVVSCEVTAKPQEKHRSSPKKPESQKEPTNISEYLFSDIFMEVNDSE